MKRENKKKRLRELESQVSFDSLTSNSSFDSTEGDEHSDEQVNGYAYEKGNSNTNGKINGVAKVSLPNDLPKSEPTNGLKTSKKTDKKYTRTRIDRNSKDFFDTLLSTGKKVIISSLCNFQCILLHQQVQSYKNELII